MLDEDQLKEYTANNKIRYLFRSALACTVIGFAMSALLHKIGAPTLKSVGASACTAFGLWLFGSIRVRPTDLSDEWKRKKTHNDIGFQVIWMLDDKGELDNRVERRDHQNSKLNTSKWALYETLGGPNPGLTIACRSNHNEGYVFHLLDTVATKVGDQLVRVHMKGTRYTDTMCYKVLLLMLNKTDGATGAQAFGRLLDQYQGLMASSKKTVAEWENRGRLNMELQEKVRKLSQALSNTHRLLESADDKLQLITDCIEHSSRLKTTEEGRRLYASVVQWDRDFGVSLDEVKKTNAELHSSVQ